MKIIPTRFKLGPFNNPGVLTHESRIAVTGFSRSGKTVFLTSLLSHLLNHDSNRFHLGDGVAIANAAIRQLDKNWNPFDYHEHRRRLAAIEPVWPEKTKVPSSLSVDFEYTNWLLCKARLTLYDIPGERFADCSMHRKSFRDWSAQQLQWLRSLQQRTPELDRFLALADSTPDLRDAGAVVSNYKVALASLYVGFHKRISPSTFALDMEGSLLWECCRGDLKAGNYQDVAEQRCAGLTDAEFAPLLLDDKSELFRYFVKNYMHYRSVVVRPLFCTLAKCHSLAVLIDLTHIFQAGEGAYDDASQFFQDVLEALKPGRTLAQTLTKPLRVWPAKVLSRPMTRIAFVATQIDRVHDGDHRRVCNLLDKLVQRHFGAYKGAEKRVFPVAAVCSAVSDDERNVLYPALHQKIEAQRDPRAIDVARLPESPDWDEWPEHWDPQAVFKDKGGFPRLVPQMPRMKAAVPDHLGLDDVFRFLAM